MTPGRQVIKSRKGACQSDTNSIASLVGSRASYRRDRSIDRSIDPNPRSIVPSIASPKRLKKSSPPSIHRALPARQSIATIKPLDNYLSSVRLSTKDLDRGNWPASKHRSGYLFLAEDILGSYLWTEEKLALLGNSQIASGGTYRRQTYAKNEQAAYIFARMIFRSCAIEWILALRYGIANILSLCYYEYSMICSYFCKKYCKS